MRNVHLYLFAGLLLMAYSSCKKCMNCSSYNKSNGNIVDVYPENCGKKASLDVQELTYRKNLPDSLELKCNRD